MAERARHPNAALAAVMRIVSTVALGLAALAVVLPGDAGEVAGGAMVTVLVAAPLLRVAWLDVRWFRERDWPFVALASALLGLAALGLAVAVLTD